MIETRFVETKVDITTTLGIDYAIGNFCKTLYPTQCWPWCLLNKQLYYGRVRSG